MEFLSEEVIYRALDYIRCGIGANYSDHEVREEYLAKYRDPIASYLRESKSELETLRAKLGEKEIALEKASELMGSLSNKHAEMQAEINQLKIELNHVHNDFSYCQDLNTNLLVERDALIAKHKELMEQEPIGYVGAKDIADLALDKINAQSIFGAPQEQWEVQTPVYAQPIPVQPSPAVAVPDIASKVDELRTILLEGTNWHPREWQPMGKLLDEIESMLSTPTPPNAEQSHKLEIQINNEGYPHISNFSKLDLPQGFYKCVILPKIEQPDSAALGEPTERQVYRWFQESTINHHIEEDGHHISKRAMFVAKKAWNAALAQVKPQRITEQDAREIVLNSFWFIKNFKDANGNNPSVIEWHEAEGIRLLAKLNEHREPDYKAKMGLLLQDAKNFLAAWDDIYPHIKSSKHSQELLEDIEFSIGLRFREAIAQCEGQGDV